MYKRVLSISAITKDSGLLSSLQEVTPLEGFSHNFNVLEKVDEKSLKESAVIILDFDSVEPEIVKKIDAFKVEDAALVGCFSGEKLSLLAENHHYFEQVWVKPFSKDQLQTSFSRILDRFKEQEDLLLTNQYLDALIDSLPDLIWFKDARGSHLKVNDSFCKTVGKTKEQIANRGHFYIWDLEPEEYDQGEYICLESEEIVLEKKETCLFDETVKCGDELRKFKTYKSPIFGRDGEVIGTVGIARDVTDLQNLLIEMNILVESLPFAVLVTDRNKTITSVNQRFVDVFQTNRRDLLNKNADSFLDPTRTFTKSGRWMLDRSGEQTLFLSKKQVLQLHDETLLDIFGFMAGHIYLFSDITLEHQEKNKLLIDANTDYLTQLNNRRSLQDFMRKTPCQPGTALLLVDLDNFKEVNDRFGHEEGDRVLVAFSELLQQVFPGENIFRLGGDEFAIMLPDVEGVEVPRTYVEKLLRGFVNEVAQQFPETDISASVGIAMDVGDGNNFGELFKKADMALYESKKAGKCRYTIWKEGY